MRRRWLAVCVAFLATISAGCSNEEPTAEAPETAEVSTPSTDTDPASPASSESIGEVSSDWADVMCASFGRLRTESDSLGQAMIEGLLALGNDPSAADPEFVTDLFEGLTQIYRDQLAELRAVEATVPPEDRAAYDIFVEIFTGFVELSEGQVRAMEALLNGADLSTYEELLRLEQDMLERQTSFIKRIDDFSSGVLPAGFGTPRQETIERLTRCDSLAERPCEGDDLTESELLLCPDQGTAPSAAEPWRLTPVVNLRADAVGLEAVAPRPDDFVEAADGSFAFEQEPIEDAVPGFALVAVQQGLCISSSAEPPITEPEVALRTSMSRVRRAADAAGVRPDAGFAVFLIEEYETEEEAIQSERAVVESVDRCVVNNDSQALRPASAPVVVWVVDNGAGPRIPVLEDLFADVVGAAPSGSSSFVWMRSGRYLALVATDAYGIADGSVEALVEVMALRLASLG